MSKREIINIDEYLCTGCGLCIPNCPEGALQIIDGKVRLVSDLFCDGLGACIGHCPENAITMPARRSSETSFRECIGHCPENAITIEEREAEEYDERKVMENIVKQGENVIQAHLSHLKEHNQNEYIKEAIEYLQEKGLKMGQKEHPRGGHNQDMHSFSGCPGAKTLDFREKGKGIEEKKDLPKSTPQLRQWPIQIKLVPPNAPYLKDADLLIAADCVPFAYADFHEDLLKGKALLVGCPKLDDVQFYQEKLTHIFMENELKSVTYAHMEVPCCFGLVNIIQAAIAASGKSTPFKEITIGIKGEKLAQS